MSVRKSAIRRNFTYKKEKDMTEKEKLDNEINNGDYLIEKILNSKKIRYENLNELIKTFPKGKDTVTMYIDIISVIGQIYAPNIIEEIKMFGSREKCLISSSIINMAAHFRRYFATRKDMYTNFIFYYSSKPAKREVSLFPNYRIDHYNKRFNASNTDYMELNNLVKENLNLCKTLGEYLPHIYFIDTEDINPTIVPYYYINSQYDNEVGIIYSNDKLQALNCIAHKNKDVYLLRSSYANSEFYKASDLMSLYVKEENNLDIGLLPYLFAISGVKKYNIDGLKNVGEKKAVKFIEKLINDNTITNTNYRFIKLFLDDLSKSDKVTPEQYNIIERNLKLIQPRYIFKQIKESDKERILEVKDLQDINALNAINDEYYDFYPINIEDLMIGEDYESV